LAQGVPTDLVALPTCQPWRTTISRQDKMSRFIRVAACAALAGSAHSACFLPDSVAGQDQFQAVNMAYIECKRVSGIDQQALCTCSSNQMVQVQGCNYAWINPWISTVMRDKGKFCGAASSGSMASSLSGSDGSSPSIGTSSQASSANSGSSNQNLTTPQKLFFLAVAVCCCLCVCGGLGGLYAMNKGAFKSKKTKPKQYDYEDDDQQDYEAQQYDQQFGDQGAGDYQGQEMAGGPQDDERWDMVQSPNENFEGQYPGEAPGQPLMQPGQF